MSESDFTSVASVSNLQAAIMALGTAMQESDIQMNETENAEESFRQQIQTGLSSMNEKIVTILDLINQIGEIINNFKMQIAELEARELPNPNPELENIINELKNQVQLLEREKIEASGAIEGATNHIIKTTSSMSSNAQKPDIAMNLELITSNLDRIIRSLQGSIEQNPVIPQNPSDVAQNPLPNDTPITIGTVTITYGELKNAVTNKMNSLRVLGQRAPPQYIKFAEVVNAVNSTPESIKQAAENSDPQIIIEGKEIRGGRRRTRTRKLYSKKKSRKSRRKNRKTRKTRRRRQQRGGYTYSETSSERKGRGFTKRRPKKC